MTESNQVSSNTDGLADELDLSAFLGVAGQVSAALKELKQLSASFASDMTNALKRIVIDGERVDKVLRQMALSISNKILDKALQRFSDVLDKLISQLLDVLANATGGILSNLFSGGGFKLFAKGGVISSPAFFPMSGGLGLAGEAEAILPLARGADGSLGVRAGGGQAPITVNVSIATPDVSGFRKSETQISAMLARAVGRGRRGL